MKVEQRRRVSYKSKLNKFSLGLFHSLTDVCLFVIYFHLQAYKIGYGKRDIGEAINKAVHVVKITNAYSLSRIIYRAKTKGYLEKKEDYIQITKLGEERLRRILPTYEKKRPWDGKLYLITYDIPEGKRKDRDYLRQYLRKIGCGMLQQSVWLTPYNPKRLVIDFIEERKLAGLVLVSELKEGSGIGGKDILTVLERVYRLDQLNEDYRNFVMQVENKKLIGNQLVMVYLTILKKDPQIPFELLPGGWWGNRAYYFFVKEVKKIRKKYT